MRTAFVKEKVFNNAYLATQLDNQVKPPYVYRPYLKYSAQCICADIIECTVDIHT